MTFKTMLKRYFIITFLVALSGGMLTTGCERAARSAAEPEETTEAPDTTKQRYVEGNLFTSTYLPAIRIEIDAAMSYVGMRAFILKDIAQVELKQRSLQSLTIQP